MLRRPVKPKQIGRAPILGRPRLFGGKLLDYIQVTQQEIPLVISSCVGSINRLGLHNQVRFFISTSFQMINKNVSFSKGIFRVPGPQVDINQFKDAFEKGDDPLVNITARDMNSVAGVLKLYFRELKEPLITREMFDPFMSSISQLINDERVEFSTTMFFVSRLVDVESEEKCVENLSQVVKLLPHPIFVVLRYFLAFLNQ